MAQKNSEGLQIGQQPLLTSIPKAARRLGCSSYTIRARLADGDLEGVHLGARHLVVVASIDRLVELLVSESRRRRGLHVIDDKIEAPPFTAA